MTAKDIRKSLGLIHYYYGNGCGKTSISMGHIVRAIGAGLKPVMMQFLKKHQPKPGKGFSYSEYITLTNILKIPVYQFGTSKFIKSAKDIGKEEKEMATTALIKLKELIRSEEIDLLILDELSIIIEIGLFDIDDVIDIIKNKRKNLEVIITGRPKNDKLVEISDYVTHLEEIKHPYQKGIMARKGIEF